ncbi:MAG TPA: His/Gly/Thr/Pro-type tRNA ligase C-terminal domain-containing protein, partial [Nitrospira sp.]|nr:His/Gly/Thr/Pro-type tRNA ligase C-terminal domain-containing protein [Nitrospira sp.]
TVQHVTGAPLGFAGPVGLRHVRILADYAVKGMKNIVIGANKSDTHYQNANLDRDFSVELFADLRNAQAGDPSPRGRGVLTLAKGIEVGQVFLLGTKYSHKMNAAILDDQGKERLAIMGCYGIGVGRTAAAAIEQNHDEKGIIWPFPIAPFHVHLLTVSQSEKTTEAAVRLYTDLAAAGIEVLWDDRADRAGVKFNDADLIGVPFQIVIGDKGLADGVAEIKIRRTGIKSRIARGELVVHLRKLSTESDPSAT